MNRSFRRKLEKIKQKEYKLFLKKNKKFLDSIKEDEGSQKTLQRIKELLDNFGNINLYGKQEQTLEGGEETISPEEERTETQGNSENTQNPKVGRQS
jgi:hypothetical protein